MNKFKTCLYSKSQVLTRKHVFFCLTGQKNFEPYKDEDDSYVFLNFNDDLCRAADMFTTLAVRLTDIQKAVLYNLICGVPNKVMAINLNLTEKYISKTITRLKEIFGGCESIAQLVANASLMQ